MILNVKDQAEFKKQLSAAGDKLVIVEFYANGNKQCQQMEKAVEVVDRDNEGLVIVKVDAEKNQEIADEYVTFTMPTFVFIRNGQELESFGGANPQKLQTMVEEYTEVEAA